MRAPDEPALHADPDLTVHTAGELLTAAEAMDAAAQPLLAALSVPAQAYGSTPAAAAVATAHELTTAGAEAAVEGFAQALHGDADRLYAAAAGYLAADDRAAGTLGGA